MIAIVGFAAVFSWQRNQQGTFQGFASGNGRLEATEVDIATKWAGRLSEVLADEGDFVQATEVVARMDTKELKAQVRAAEAEARRAQYARNHATAVVAQRESELGLAESNLERARNLYENQNISVQELQHKLTAMKTAAAVLAASEANLANAAAAIEAATASVERVQAQLDESILVAPINGRVLYRLAEPGEVLPAGGKVLSLIDLDDVDMTIFLSEADAGKVLLGSEARIVLDAIPDMSIGAHVSFVSPKAQFTPKHVETRTERSK
ncbi:MAG: HlyD family efflux transporter periplasmic adaptor subunit, partial [Gammaproteobacteria bacterium]|nr:HlyD family efflux transporter periplasmic adaptor subunit [Gammaproteobacteria bacterium]